MTAVMIIHNLTSNPFSRAKENNREERRRGESDRSKIFMNCRFGYEGDSTAPASAAHSCHESSIMATGAALESHGHAYDNQIRSISRNCG
jgi:hypothetical protein